MTTTHQQLRDAFSSFWEEKKHIEIPPISLVPPDDPTTLFTGSGMQQLVPYLTTGNPHPLGKRLFNIQRSFRSQDIEEVGDNRHTTFFEMMGNWSLGDYFKSDQIPWVWDFFTNVLKLPREKLFVSIFEGNKEVPRDEESEKLWRKLGVSKDHIFSYPADKNWWSRSGTPEKMPEGEVGGPDSEVFYEFTQVLHNPQFGKICHPNCDCSRFLEIGNSVFIQYKKRGGTLEELPNTNVDFGGGLERILAAINNDPDVFKTDVLWPAIESVQQITNLSYFSNQSPMRIIADHIRAATFLISDGVLPSNKQQGYVLRRLIRRAMKYAYLYLKIKDSFTGSVAMKVIETFSISSGYINLINQEDNIMKVLQEEENKFWDMFIHGLEKADTLLKKNIELNGKIAFDLFQSHGFPIELTIEYFENNKAKISPEINNDFMTEISKHQQLSRTSSSGKFKGGLADQSEQTVKLHTATHLLHQALRDLLGKTVQQKGSNITSERLRFDFSYPEKLSNEEIKRLEFTVNQKIQESLEVTSQVTSYEDAKKKGALAFFGQRYPEKVSVYSIGNFSKEICGGPHVKNTKELGLFKIIKEESAGAGIRRLYAILE